MHPASHAHMMGRIAPDMAPTSCTHTRVTPGYVEQCIRAITGGGRPPPSVQLSAQQAMRLQELRAAIAEPYDAHNPAHVVSAR
jgi:hypothetical protein